MRTLLDRSGPFLPDPGPEDRISTLPKNPAPPPAVAVPAWPEETFKDDKNSGLVSRHIALIKEKKDPEAMNLIMERYLGFLIRYVARRCGAAALPGEGPEDLASETLHSFWHRASRGKFPKRVFENLGDLGRWC